MSISFAQACELQERARRSPNHAEYIIGDLIAQINSTTLRPVVPTQTTALTPEQQEQRLLDNLIAVRKQKEEAQAKAKAEEVKEARLNRIERAIALSQATSDVLQAIRGQVNYDSGDVVSRDTWWKFRKDLAPVVAAHGFKLVNVGTKSKPKAALAEV